jgi:hypothetical protein
VLGAIISGIGRLWPFGRGGGNNNEEPEINPKTPPFVPDPNEEGGNEPAETSDPEDDEEILGNIFKKVFGWTTDIKDILASIGGEKGIISNIQPILNFFTTGDDGQDQQNATRLQQQLEEAAKDIERRYVAGEIDISTANHLLGSINGLSTSMMNSGNAHFQVGGVAAQRIINNVEGTLRTAYHGEADTPYDTAKGFTGGEEKQKSNLRNLMRDMGSGAQFTGLEDSPFSGLFNKFDVGAAADQAGAAVRPGGNLAHIFTQPGTEGADRLSELRGTDDGGSNIFNELGRRRVSRSFKDLDEFNFNKDKNPLEDAFNKGNPGRSF